MFNVYFQIHLSFSLDRDPVLDEESKAESEGNVIIRAILNLLNHFATIIGNAKNTELKYVCMYNWHSLLLY